MLRAAEACTIRSELTSVSLRERAPCLRRYAAMAASLCRLRDEHRAHRAVLLLAAKAGLCAIKKHQSPVALYPAKSDEQVN